MSSSCIEQTSPLQQLDMNLPSRPSLVTPPPSPPCSPVSSSRKGLENTYLPIPQSSSSSSRKRKAPKVVRFRPVVEIYAAPSPLDAVLNDDETNAWKNDLWFTVEDLAEFRNTARELCRQMRTSAAADHHSSTVTACSDPQTRGLEQRSCLERQRRKYIATRFILKAASQLRSHPNPSKPLEERLAAVAQKCNSWATLLAIEEAARDYGRAYFADNDNDDEDESRDDRESTAAATSCVAPSSSLKRHHHHYALEEATRRVRARLS